MKHLSSLVALLSLGCTPDEGPGPGDTGIFVSDPELTVFDARKNPLGFWLDAETRANTTLTVSVDGEPLPVSSTGAVHHVKVLGFKPDRTSIVTVEATADGASERVELEVATPPLPDDFPRAEVLVHDAARMAPGLTLVLVRPASFTGPEYVVVYDSDGEVVWYYEYQTPKMADISLLPNGRLMVLGMYDEIDGGPLIELELDGAEIARYDSFEAEVAGAGVVVPSHGWHHEALRRPDGRTVALTKESLPIAQFPQSYSDPTDLGPAVVSADVLVEWDPSGAITGFWPIAAWMPQQRIGYESLEPTNFDGLVDWTHGNGADVDEVEDTVILSLRNQDCVVKLDRSNRPVWILGNPANWPEEQRSLLLTPDASVEWFYKQHAPMLSPDGSRVLLFDNGESRSSPYDGLPVVPEEERYSRVVEYSIDEGAKTVRQTWALRESGPGSLYSPIIGDADYLTNGNILGTFGHTSHEAGVSPTAAGDGEIVVRIIEADPGAASEIVWDLRLSSPVEDRPGGWYTYRGDRIDSLYGDADP